MEHGKLNCTEKNIWCIWTDLDTGKCTKVGECDVGTDAWKARKRKQEQRIEENRRRAAERTQEKIHTSEERKVVKIPDKHKAADPALSELIWNLQRTEEQMARAYRTGKEGFGDRLYREALELKRRIKEQKGEK